MTEQTPVAGTLGGINLSGEDEAPDVTLPPDDERISDPPSEPTPPADAPEPADAPQDPVAPPEAAPEAPKAKRTRAKKGAATTPARNYVVLKQERFEDTSAYYTKVHEVEARNAQNAMRLAFRDMVEDEQGEATLVVIPASMFRPTPVKLSKTEKVSVSFG